jgi:hypothetical protein
LDSAAFARSFTPQEECGRIPACPSNAKPARTLRRQLKSTTTEQELPEGWTHKRIREVIEHYENQTEDEELAELETPWDSSDDTIIHVPNELAPAVRSLIAHYERLRAG